MANNWGFGINEKRSIDLDTNNFDIVRKILEAEPSFHRCISCGSCTATCSAGNITNFNFRKVHHLLRRGEYQTLSGEISKCMLCGKCSLVCPRGINTRNIILNINRLITRQNLR